jgi:hypothetical protein
MKFCFELDCPKRANYNYSTEKSALYCATHKKDNMIDINHIKCVENDCPTRANYNYSTQTKPLYCATHKKDNMIDVISTKCIENGCNKQPTYNLSTKHKPIYCLKHKTDNMIDVIHDKCMEIDCLKQPTYNISSETKAIYCFTHKKDNMIDLVHNKCIEPDCIKRMLYNLPTKSKALYCFNHKKDNMVCFNTNRCIEDDCTKRPTYNFSTETKPLYCLQHKKDSMINVINARCKTHMCSTIVSNKKYKGYCMRCFIHLFPDEKVAFNYKTKERATLEYILEYFKHSGYTWIADKTINNGCSKRRPDLLLDLGYQVIIIEIDENQHDVYDCSCQNKRIMELSTDVGHRPIIFIRFNPDGYINNKTKIRSCWCIDGRGICVVNKSKQAEWTLRLKSLSDQVEYWTDTNNKTDKTVEIIQLFYDN